METQGSKKALLLGDSRSLDNAEIIGTRSGENLGIVKVIENIWRPQRI